MDLQKYISPTLPALVTLQEHPHTSSKSNNVKDHANATSGNRMQSRRDDPAAAASAKNASGSNDGTKVTTDIGKKVAEPFYVQISSGNNAAFKELSLKPVVAEWPAWLANVAPKAIEGWLPRQADSFDKIDKIGQGTYSNVYRARDRETGRIVALKKLQFNSMDAESVRFMVRQILVLRRLDHPNIIKLEGLATSHVSQRLYLVFEYMEHDLAGLIATPGFKLAEPQIKCFVQQLLHGLDHCHKNGVLHRDIKSSNLLIDSNGTLKIADFEWAISYDPNNPQPLTSHVVTLWYRSPELLLGATEYGVAVDMWSTGCIVAELFAGKPIMPGTTEVEQIYKIFELCGSPAHDYCKKSKVPDTAMFKPQRQYRRCVAETFKAFPPSAVVLIDSLLSLEPQVRGTASSALQSDFFRTEPLACDPSSLPMRPSWEDYDFRLRATPCRRGAQSFKTGNENHVTSRAANGAAQSKEHVKTSSKCKNVKDHANATSENRTQSRKDVPAAAASAKNASGSNDGCPIVTPDIGKKVVAPSDVRISSGNNAVFKELSLKPVVAEWPAWLTNVAPKAIEGWLPRRADSFDILNKIGQGTYSYVYKAQDRETGRIVALKKVQFNRTDSDSVCFMVRQIHVLRRLDHPNIIKLEAVATSRVLYSLYLVFEYMEHDLSALVATPGLKLTEPQIKCFVQQLLHGLDHYHKSGVLHRDIKISNLLIDSNGTLKIADFDWAISYDPNYPRSLTSHVGTLWYRPPELLLGATKYGVAVDMWSTGCIIAELFAGKPIMPGRTEVEQIYKIFELCGWPADDYCKKSNVPETALSMPQQQYRRCVAETFNAFPPSAVLLIDSLLSLEPQVRGTASSALQSDFFRTEPLACDLSSLPKLPPSKEYDEEPLRQQVASFFFRVENGRGN
ncbi:hypothetical protein BRADI_4g40416v3 [Brachypodium distachyon]|uniref:[RNA-polymerase]-subunit kinase n=1 Tax=Brachypodium distachyon TaxID=15368 RepID=A0A2K2CTH0_BRADI|nr:hypothetical protein BRADI_4g40416v3 [Brachypodium distachyon]